MPDEVDRGNDAAQALLDDALAAHARLTAQRKLFPAGECHYCGEATAPYLLFCCIECSRDYEHEQAARRRNGG